MSDKSYATAISLLAKNAELATKLDVSERLVTTEQSAIRAACRLIEQIHIIATNGWSTSGNDRALKRIIELTTTPEINNRTDKGPRLSL